jgi:hypothetical protein
MTIETITPAQKNELLEIYTNNPNLTLQNKGYEKPQKLSESDKLAAKQVESILSKHIKGFESFTNFRLTKNNSLQIRFQYNWEADNEKRTQNFTGVGYILVDELLNGFN